MPNERNIRLAARRTGNPFLSASRQFRLACMAIPSERFSPDELDNCLRHYDLGDILEVKPFSGGSRLAPKVLIETSKGKFLFKRRAKGKDDLAKVAFTHQIQVKLADECFPMPHLIPIHSGKKSMLVVPPRVYEMFEFIEGSNYDGSPESTFQAGRTLGIYHELLEGFKSDYRPPKGTYHDAETITQAIRSIVGSLPLKYRPPANVVTATVSSIEEAYTSCAARANDLGLADWPIQIVHGDWHPGNMLFRDRCVVAVIDYDAARMQQRVIDLANGALQFSIIGGKDAPANWPVNVDQGRFRKFMQGYDSVSVVSTRELQAIPLLMCEAMIAEAVLPIAATGSFGGMQGFPFLQMIESKVNWILSHTDILYAAVDG